MHLIIDGYNLLGARGQVGGAGRAVAEEARERLLRELTGYRQRKGHPITVVFDAWQQPGGTRHEHRAGVGVIYTAHGERADQVIQRLAEQFGRDCAVVSSDREVANFVKAHGGFVIGALEFDSKLRPAAPSMRSEFKPAEPREIEPPRSPAKKGNPKKLPKSVRKRNRRLKAF